MNLLKSAGFLFNFLASFHAFAGNFSKNIGTRGIFINEALARRAYLTGKQNAQQQAGLPDGVDDLCRPVGLCVVILELMLAIPTHKAHQADPGDEEQNAGEADQCGADTCPVDLAEAGQQTSQDETETGGHHRYKGLVQPSDILLPNAQYQFPCHLTATAENSEDRADHEQRRVKAAGNDHHADTEAENGDSIHQGQSESKSFHNIPPTLMATLYHAMGNDAMGKKYKFCPL